MTTYTAAPLSTIDISALKPSRFLWERGSEPPALPYRDEAGRISVHLLRKSSAQLEELQAPQDVAEKCTKWLKHAEHWLNTGGETWQRGPTGAWISNSGEKRREPAAQKATPGTACPQHPSTSLTIP